MLTLSVRQFYYYCLTASLEIIIKKPKNTSFFYNPSLVADESPVTELTTRYDFFSLTPIKQCSLDAIVTYYFTAMNKETKNADANEGVYKMISQDPVEYNCDIEEVKTEGKKYFLSKLDFMIELHGETNSIIGEVADNDVFALLKNEVIAPLLKDDSLMFSNESEQLSGVQGFFVTSDSIKKYSFKPYALQKICNLISALIYSYQFKQKINLAFDHTAFIHFFENTSQVNKYVNEAKYLSYLKQNKEFIITTLFSLDDKDEEMLSSMLTDYTKNREINTIREPIVTAIQKIKSKIIKRIYKTIKTEFSDNDLFKKITNYVLICSNEFFQNLVKTNDEFSTESLLHFVDHRLKEFSLTDSIVVSRDSKFLSHCICRVIVYMEILKKNRDIVEYLILCKSFRLIQKQLLQAASNHSFLSVIPISNPGHEYDLQQFLVPIKAQVRSIVASYLFSSIKTADFSIDINDFLNKARLKILTDVSRIFYKDIKVIDINLRTTKQNNVSLIKKYCTVLSEEIVDQIIL